MDKKQQELLAIIKSRYITSDKTPKNFKPRKITLSKKSNHIQDEANCRLYSEMNAGEMMFPVKIDEIKLKDTIKYFDIDINIGQKADLGAYMTANYLGENIVAYQLDVLTQTKLFAKLLFNGYVFTYTRNCGDEVLADIRDNDKMDTVHIGMESPHQTTISFDPKTKELVENGSRGDESRFNVFTYPDVTTFIKMVRTGAISSKVYFLDYKQS